MNKTKQTVTIIVCIIVIATGMFTLTAPDALVNYKKDTDFEYTEENGAIVLTKYNGKCENLIVPSEIDSKPVKVIRGAFCNNNTIKNIRISDGIEEIDYMAFYGCMSLVNVNLPDSVKSIGNAAFLGCMSLESIKLGDSVTQIMPYAFSNCIFLKRIKLPQSVVFIGENAFLSCSRLERLTIPASTEVIGGVTQEKGETIIDQKGSLEHTSFDGCVNLKLKISEGNKWYAIENGEIVKATPHDS